MADVTALGRCPYRGCPVRWPDGADALCRDHSDERDARRLLGGFGIEADWDLVIQRSAQDGAPAGAAQDGSPHPP
jgi:hypothetical protein